MKKLIALAVVVACSTTAMAQSTGNLYGEAAYAMVTVKDVSTTDNFGSFKPTLGRFTLGTVITDNVAVEGFVTQGLSSDSKSISGVTLGVKNKMGYGIAVRPFFQATQDIEVFGRLGSVRSEIEATVTGNGRSVSLSSKTTSSLYGVGVAYKIDKNITAVVDYTKLATKEELETSMLAIGIRFNF